MIVVLASGGAYSNERMKAFDFVEPYLRTILGFIGITNMDVASVEGVTNSSIGPAKALADM